MSEPTPKRKPGPPRTASDANRRAQGNPPLLMRLPPDIHTTVMALGGGRWVRGLIDKALAEK